LRQPVRTGNSCDAAGRGSGIAATAGHAPSRKHGRCPAGMAIPSHPCGTRSGAAADPAGYFRCGLRRAGQVADTADGLPRPVPARWDAVARGTGRRGGGPLVGCSQRRWTRTSRAVRRPRSWPRTEVIVGRVSERASSKPRSSICSPVTAPSCQQPTTAWATWSGSTPSLAQVSWGQVRSSRSDRPRTPARRPPARGGR
jgi:hypothetical protein